MKHSFNKNKVFHDNYTKWERGCLGLDPNIDCCPLIYKTVGAVPSEIWETIHLMERKALHLNPNQY
jgi:hypothetical protein